MLSWFYFISVNFKSEGSKITIIDSSASFYIFLDVVTESSDDKVELGFGIKRFDGFVGSGLRGLMFSWVVAWMCDDPECWLKYQW